MKSCKYDVNSIILDFQKYFLSKQLFCDWSIALSLNMAVFGRLPFDQKFRCEFTDFLELFPRNFCAVGPRFKNFGMFGRMESTLCLFCEREKLCCRVLAHISRDKRKQRP